MRLRLRNTRRFVESRLRNLQSMLTGEPRLVRGEIAKHVEKIILTPEEGPTSPLASGICSEVWLLQWCRGPESNWLRPPFQGGALPVSYPGTLKSVNFRGARKGCQLGRNSVRSGAFRGSQEQDQSIKLSDETFCFAQSNPGSRQKIDEGICRSLECRR